MGNIKNLVSKFDTYIRTHKPEQLVIPPLIVLALALIVLGGMYVATGSPVRLGFQFEGGTIVELATSDSHDDLRLAFADYPLIVVSESGNRRMLRFGPMEGDMEKSLVEKVNTEYEYATPEIKQANPIYAKARHGRDRR